MGQEKMSNIVSPAMDQVTIGIDISKDHLDVAIMRKLLIIANALLRDQRMWTPDLASA
jgi:hypothetical protein